ncbi:Hypothetical protein, putative [Bodo saltans]|uniref:Uncharacterized protein n=1 Tax=Bodo saltans TaxID=75058 RepID=A0A0S4II75_BODSA|nr:Hypothetical protein, putative [Bodo saltans]|eukprot:CUE70903.1 Hypothetical protein, putative [Bodo saltans]
MSPCGVGVDGAGALIVSACEFCGIYKILRNGTTTVVAGVIGICGTTDGIGSIARFYYPSSVATDAQQNVAYITDQGNSRIRAMDLLTYNVTTVTGSSANYREGAFSTALFNYCSGVIFRSTATGKVLYITDNKNNRIRKANFSSLLVSTVAIVPVPFYLDLSVDEVRLFVGSDNGAIFQVYLPNSSATILAGADGVSGYVDAVGPAARFHAIHGVALNHDESALFVGDWLNYVLRRIELSNRSVTTAAGTGAMATIEGGSVLSMCAKWLLSSNTNVVSNCNILGS